jgi:fructose-1,6-bisphosphatase I
MQDPVTLARYLNRWAARDALRCAVAETVSAIAEAGIAIADLVALGPLAGDLAASRGHNLGGDGQKELDVLADDILAQRLHHAPVALVGSEEMDTAALLDPDGLVDVALDPLDGSSNIDTNVSIGTLFSILPHEGVPEDDADAAFLRPGSCQLAAGFLVYGPQTTLVLTVGEGSALFVLDRRDGRFLLARTAMAVPTTTSEYAINASNYRHWPEPIRGYIDDCVAGSDGPPRRDFNMRWMASMVAEAFRILTRGGVYLYPADARKGYANGRLRLVYEANPVAFLMEQAGGLATDGRRRILDIVPTALHQRIPLVFGSVDQVERVALYHLEPFMIADRAPLFGHRGLLRG